MKVVEDIASRIVKLRNGLLRTCLDPEINIYIDYPTWYNMMWEIDSNRSGVAFDVWSSRGKKIMGYSIHLVNTEGHGIRVYGGSK